MDMQRTRLCVFIMDKLQVLSFICLASLTQISQSINSRGNKNFQNKNFADFADCVSRVFHKSKNLKSSFSLGWGCSPAGRQLATVGCTNTNHADFLAATESQPSNWLAFPQRLCKGLFDLLKVFVYIWTSRKICLKNSLNLTYYTSKKSWPNLYSNLL